MKLNYFKMESDAQQVLTCQHTLSIAAYLTT